VAQAKCDEGKSNRSKVLRICDLDKGEVPELMGRVEGEDFVFEWGGSPWDVKILEFSLTESINDDYSECYESREEDSMYHEDGTRIPIADVAGR